MGGPAGPAVPGGEAGQQTGAPGSSAARGPAVPAPFVTAPAWAYRALCLPLPDRDELLVVLLAGEEGAVYVPDPLERPADAAAVEAALRRLRLRPSSTSLALRLPAGLTAPGAGGRVARFTLWASPAYQAASRSGSAVWK
ncbi:MAG TPA: hypothetical protein VH257_22025 [Chloroflexota bacterium]|nr:hypothetical protein [Chloroflexota bacterium]